MSSAEFVRGWHDGVRKMIRFVNDGCPECGDCFLFVTDCCSAVAWGCTVGLTHEPDGSIGSAVCDSGCEANHAKLAFRPEGLAGGDTT